MKKALGQTVRDIKREVNKKVLKVPSIEQKVLDATSNEPWGPHGSHLADIAQASRNYHEYQMIMSVIWKRINDTGKNWRHVYKALTVLEYLVGNGSERVIDDIREHAYQISTLSEFQYIDSGGRDQGSNVRKKSQSLVVLVNDKERIQEVRQKAAANREKYRNTSAGGMSRPGGYGDRYDDDHRYGGEREEERNGYGRERDDDRYGGKYGVDSYGRDYEDRTSRDGYRDDDYRGRSRNDDDYNYGSRSRSADRNRDRSYEDDGQYSSRGSNARGDDPSQDGSVTGKPMERKFSEQNLSAPPSYEEAVADSRSPVRSERNGETPAAPAPPKSSSPVNHPSNQATIAPISTPAEAAAPAPANKKNDSFDEFDPRSSFSAAAAPPASNGAGLDLFGSLSDDFSSNSMALAPAATATTTSVTPEIDAFANSGAGQSYVATSSASSVPNQQQPFDDPFGDGPFRAIPSTNGASAQTVNVDSFQPTTSSNQSSEQTVNDFSFGEAFPGGPFSSSLSTSTQLVPSPQYSHQEPSNPSIDILADILPPPLPQTGSSFPSQPPSFQDQQGQTAFQSGFPPQSGLQLPSQMGQQPPSGQTNFPVQMGQQPPSGQTNFPVHMGQQPPSGHSNFPVQMGQQQLPPQFLTGFSSQVGQQPAHASAGSYHPSQAVGFFAPNQPQTQPGHSNPNYYGNFQGSYGAPSGSHINSVGPGASSAQHNSTGNILGQPSASSSSSQLSALQARQSAPVTMTAQPAAANSTSLALVPQQQPAKEKFETKSTVWTDTLNRGLVNLNISGPKTNPLADIGVDFDAINRREKRMEKPSATAAVSNVSMGKAMGSGSGMGRAGMGALRAPSPNPMMGSSGGIGMMGGYNQQQQQQQQQQHMMGGGVGMRMGMGVNMGMAQQGFQMQQQQPPAGFPPGGYNPMAGPGAFGQPYGGYR